jgi:uncharacterized HAD superfamily protein
MRIGIDIDDVIAKTGPVFYQKINERFGLDLEFTKVPSYSFVDEQVFKKGFSREEFYGYLTEMQLNSPYHDSLLVRRGFKKTIKKLYQEGNIIYLVSNRHVLILPYTTVWLKNLGILPFISGVLHNSYSKKPYRKFKINEAKRLKLDVFLEDALDFALPIARAGIKVILFDRPWNQKKPLPKNMFRVDDWEAAAAVIEKLNSHLGAKS